jgi:hypothetical protein
MTLGYPDTNGKLRKRLLRRPLACDHTSCGQSGYTSRRLRDPLAEDQSVRKLDRSYQSRELKGRFSALRHRLSQEEALWPREFEKTANTVLVTDQLNHDDVLTNSVSSDSGTSEYVLSSQHTSHDLCP